MKPKLSVRTEYSEHYDEYQGRYSVLDEVVPESVSVQCPHCPVYSTVRINAVVARKYWKFDLICSCPNCENTIFIEVQYNEAIPETRTLHGNGELEVVGLVAESTDIISIFPIKRHITIAPEIPEKYWGDYREAKPTLNDSSKASAALSRRILQNVLREEFRIKHPSLASEIEDFIKHKDVPSYLSSAVDAIRNVGNFAAHPLKDTNTGEIVNVEVGEAEWLLEVIDALFDFTFIQPQKLAERKQQLNAKLKSMGKPPMKE